MPTIGFFRQKRADGGVRTGVGVNDVMLWEHFKAGRRDSDPALRWYIDLLFEGNRLPTEAQAARDWLLEQKEFICDNLRKMAERLEIGLDSDVRPFRYRLKNAPRGVRGDLVVSGVRSLSEGELARELKSLARRWQATIDALAPFASV